MSNASSSLHCLAAICLSLIGMNSWKDLVPGSVSTFLNRLSIVGTSTKASRSRSIKEIQFLLYSADRNQIPVEDLEYG